MARVLNITGVIDDGLAAALGVAPPPPAAVVQVANGENITLHLVLLNPSGNQVKATSQRVITYAVSTAPLPLGQQLFQHIAAISLRGDGGWDLPIVANDYKNIVTGTGRFLLDVWLTDSTISPPQSNPVIAVSAFIVTPAAVNVGGPSTAPVPAQLTAYGLPSLVGTSGAVLQSLGVSGGVQSMQWAYVAKYVGPWTLTARPAPNTVAEGSWGWNRTTKKPNFSDGATGWYDTSGVVN